MTVLALGIAAVFVAVGLILAWSKSTKGSTVVTFLLGLFGGSGLVFGRTHQSIGSLQLDAASIGWLLAAMGGGTVAGLVFGMAWKLSAQKKGQKVDIGVFQPKIDPNKKIP